MPTIKQLQKGGDDITASPKVWARRQTKTFSKTSLE